MSGIKKIKPLDIESGYGLEDAGHSDLKDGEVKETDQILQAMSDTLEKINDHMDNDKTTIRIK